MQAAKKFPDVDQYHGRWPVADLIKMHLKNTSSKYRKRVQKMAAGKSVDAGVSIKPKGKGGKKVGNQKLKVWIQTVILTFRWLPAPEG
jgi:hypothetical protein